MAYARKSSGGVGGLITALVILALLAAVAYIAWWRIQRGRAPQPEPTDPKSVVTRWKASHGLKGSIPEPLGSDWHFSFETPRYVNGLPVAWTELVLERGRFTALSLAASRDADQAPPMGLIKDLAGELEGGTLLAYVGELGQAEPGAILEKETPNYRFLAWRSADPANPRRSLICIALKSGGPSTDEFYRQQRADWEKLPRKPEPKPPAKEPPLPETPKPAPAAEPPKAPPAAGPPNPAPAPEPPKAPPAPKPPEPSPVERAL